MVAEEVRLAFKKLEPEDAEPDSRLPAPLPERSYIPLALRMAIEKGPIDGGHIQPNPVRKFALGMLAVDGFGDTTNR